MSQSFQSQCFQIKQRDLFHKLTDPDSSIEIQIDNLEFSGKSENDFNIFEGYQGNLRLNIASQLPQIDESKKEEKKEEIDEEKDEEKDDEKDDEKDEEKKNIVSDFENKIFVKRTIQKQNKNTPRFIMRIALQILPKLKKLYPKPIGNLIDAQCRKLQKWHFKEKKNVFLLKHLEYLFANEEVFGVEGSQLNRKFLQQFLTSQCLKMMSDPKSQIKHNILDYHRCVKIYALRCRSKKLVVRNQCQ